MICSRCGGHVEWKGPLINLTHTECASCGGINCQIVEPIGEGYSDDVEIDEHGDVIAVRDLEEGEAIKVPMHMLAKIASQK